jgi:hypothetical protein
MLEMNVLLKFLFYKSLEIDETSCGADSVAEQRALQWESVGTSGKGQGFDFY